MKQKEEKIITNIESDVVFKGVFRFQDTLQVKGTLQGEVLSQSGQILLENPGKIEGKVTASRLENHGYLNGNGEIEDYVLYQDGISEGQWNVKSLMVEKGALFNGNCKMEK